jgi:hypothetical protein
MSEKTVAKLPEEPHIPLQTEFPVGTSFVVKEGDVPLAFIPTIGWVNWFGGIPRPYDPHNLKVDNNCPAESFEAWIALVVDSIKQ